MERSPEQALRLDCPGAIDGVQTRKRAREVPAGKNITDRDDPGVCGGGDAGVVGWCVALPVYNAWLVECKEVSGRKGRAVPVCPVLKIIGSVC